MKDFIQMTKKKYFKTKSKHRKRHKCEYCTCMIARHRYWMSKKYYGEKRVSDG
jgi:hypothetical protein